MMREVQLGMRDTGQVRRKKSKGHLAKHHLEDCMKNAPPSHLFMRQELQFLGHYLNRSNSKLLKQEDNNLVSAVQQAAFLNKLSESKTSLTNAGGKNHGNSKNQKNY